MNKQKQNPHRGSSFDSFLADEGILEPCTETAKQRVRRMQAEDNKKKPVTR